MLQTLRSGTKINILNPNLDVKMFIKGVQTYLESIFSVPFVPNTPFADHLGEKDIHFREV